MPKINKLGNSNTSIFFRNMERTKQNKQLEELEKFASKKLEAEEEWGWDCG